MRKKIEVIGKIKLASLLFLILGVQNLMAQEPIESDFYTPPTTTPFVFDIVDGPFTNPSDAADGTDELEDSAAVNKAIDYLIANHGGGTVNIPAGNFYIKKIKLQSNIHILISPEATLFPILTGDRAFVFIMGVDGEPTINNVSIQGDGGMFDVDFRGIPRPVDPSIPGTPELGARFVTCLNVHNFKISDVNILDNQTKFPSINLNAVLNELGDYVYPTNGVFNNINQTDSHYGYGIIQAQAAKNILFNNLTCAGGVTLRLETDVSVIAHYIDPTVQLDQIFARNIHSLNGQSAIHMQPHNNVNGFVDLRNITAVSSEYGVKVDPGFLSPSKGSLLSDEDLGRKIGSFDSSSIIRNVTVTYGENAQVRKQFYRFIPCLLRDKIGGVASDSKSTFGPSAAPATNTPAFKLMSSVGTTPLVYSNDPADFVDGDSHYKIDFSEADVTAIGFLNIVPKIIVRETDDYEMCSSTPGVNVFIRADLRNTAHSNPDADPGLDAEVLSLDDVLLKNETVIIYPNPATNYITVESKVDAVLELYNTLGVVVKKQKITGGQLNNIDILNLNSGICYLKLNANESIIVRKIIIE